MVYIHVKKVGNKRYYTLRVSSRDKDGKVITKDLENLGTDIKKITIKSLEKKYSKEIRSSYRTLKRFLDSNHYLENVKKKKLKKQLLLTKEQLEKIEAAKLHYDKVFLKVHKKTQLDIYKLFLIKFAVSSTSIEGNTITLEQAYRLLVDDILPKGKNLREVYDLQNTQDVFLNLHNKKPPLSLKLIEKVHDSLLKNIDHRKGYRSHDIRIFGQPFKPSYGKYVIADMKILLNWYKKHKNKLHPLVLATLFHHKFENIHPFSDGNGRTGRILLNHILNLQNYPPINISKTTRNEYITVLSLADESIKKDLNNVEHKSYLPLINFIVDQYYKTYWSTFLI